MHKSGWWSGDRRPCGRACRECLPVLLSRWRRCLDSRATTRLRRRRPKLSPWLNLVRVAEWEVNVVGGVMQWTSALITSVSVGIVTTDHDLRSATDPSRGLVAARTDLRPTRGVAKSIKWGRQQAVSSEHGHFGISVWKRQASCLTYSPDHLIYINIRNSVW